MNRNTVKTADGQSYSADSQGATRGQVASPHSNSGYAIPQENGGGTIYAVPAGDETRASNGKQFLFENPVYDFSHLPPGTVPDNRVSSESNTDGTAKRQPPSSSDAGSTLTIMMLKQQLTFYKRAAGGLALLAFVLLIGLIVVSSRSKIAQACAPCVHPTSVFAGQDESAASSSIGSSSNSTTQTFGAGTSTSPTSTSSTLTTAYNWQGNATKCAADLGAAESCCSQCKRPDDLGIGDECYSNAECSGGRQCLDRCCTDGADRNCLVCGLAGNCAACAKGFFLGAQGCIAQNQDGEAGCSSSNECASGRACRGNVCCNEDGAADGVTKCSSTGSGVGAGNALQCIKGMYLENGQCFAANLPGQSCGNDRECMLGSCRGSVCCNAFGQTAGCTACAIGTGKCLACDGAPHELHSSGLCTKLQTTVAATTTATTVTTTASTTTQTTTKTTTTRPTTVQTTPSTADHSATTKSIIIPESNGAKSMATITTQSTKCNAACASKGRTCSDVLMERAQSYASASAENFCSFVKDTLGLSFDPGNSNVICQAGTPHQMGQEPVHHFGLGCSHNAWIWHNDFSKMLTGCNTKTYAGGVNTINFHQGSKLECDDSPFIPGAFVHAPKICMCDHPDQSTIPPANQPLTATEKLIVIPGSTSKAVVTLTTQSTKCNAACASKGRTCSDALMDRAQSYASASAENFCSFVKDTLGLSFDPGNSNVICQAGTPHQMGQEPVHHFGLGCSHNAWIWHNDFSKMLTGCNTKTYAGGVNTINFHQGSKLECDDSPFIPGAFVHAPKICMCEP